MAGVEDRLCPVLQAVWVSCIKRPPGGYRLEAGTHLPPMLFDDGQAVALAVALQSAATGATIAEDASRALATLRQIMPPRLRHRIDLLRITAVQPPAAADDTPQVGHTPQVDAQVLIDLGRTIHTREELRFDYAQGPSPSADDARREDWRAFRVDRIRPRTPAGPPRPQPPDLLGCGRSGPEQRQGGASATARREGNSYVRAADSPFVMNAHHFGGRTDRYPPIVKMAAQIVAQP